MKVIELHKKQMEWWKNKLGIDDYAVAWIASVSYTHLTLPTKA